MDIRFYDFDFNHLADFPRFISANFEKKYCGYGTVEVHFGINETEILALLEDNPYLLIFMGENSAVVTGYKIDKDIAVFGRTPEWLLTKRGTEKLSFSDMTPVQIVETIVEKSADFVVVAESKVVDSEKVDEYKTDKVKVLHDVVCEVLNTQQLGFSLTPDISLKSFIFEVYKGHETTVILSKSNRTAHSMNYTLEKQDSATKSGWYERKFEDMGEWNASTNVPQLTPDKPKNAYTCYRVTEAGRMFDIDFAQGEYIYAPNPDGSWRRSAGKPDNVWLYINNGTEEKGAKRWDTVLSGVKTESEATAEINKKTPKETATTETRNVEYKKDYGLGDVVCVHFEFADFKKVERKRITAVNIYHDVDKAGIKPILSGLEE